MTAPASKTKPPAPGMIFYPRDFLILLSLANLGYLRIWEALLDRGYGMSVLPHSPNRNLLAAAVLNVVLLATASMAATTAFRNLFPGRGENVGRGLFLFMLVIPVFEFCWVLRKRYMFFDDLLSKWVVAALCVAAVLLSVALWLWHGNPARLGAVILISFSPLVALNFGGVVMMLVSPGDPLGDRPTAPLNLNARAGPRVLWFVFDEWDYQFTFRTRPPGLKLPEIDRFAATAFSATNALPPASKTMRSIPMLLSGERYIDQRLAAVDRFEVRPIDQPRYASWTSRGLVFAAARDLGVNTAVAGWYLPYCRLLAGQLNGCTWLPMNIADNSFRDDTLGHAMVDETRSLVETISFSPFGNSLAAIRHVETYRRLADASIRLTTDPRYGLVFSHLPVPHYPYPYDWKTQTFARKISYAPRDYFNGLALLDRTIGEIRRALEAAGQWDNSVILFSTDHYFRWAIDVDGTNHMHVPFLLKFPHQDHAVAYDKRFNTITSKMLVLAILRGEVRTPEETAAWLARYAIDCPTLGSLAEYE